jgi:hypothetical protein
MGYRSEIRCLIYGTKENLEAYITETALISGSRIFNKFKDNLTRYTANPLGVGTPAPVHVLDFYADGWKWAPEYEDVDLWMAFMRAAEEAGLQYEFVRIGENPEDIEKEYSTYPLMMICIQRSIYEDMVKSETIPLIF